MLAMMSWIQAAVSKLLMHDVWKTLSKVRYAQGMKEDAYDGNVASLASVSAQGLHTYMHQR